MSRPSRAELTRVNWGSRPPIILGAAVPVLAMVPKVASRAGAARCDSGGVHWLRSLGLFADTDLTGVRRHWL